MERQTGRIIFSILLIALGVFVLLGNLNLLPIDINSSGTFWMLAFGAGGLAFMTVYLTNIQENWWATIPGFTLLGLAALVGIPFFQGPLGGGFFLGMIGLSFITIFLTRREHWWAVIPGGALLTVGLVATVADTGSGFDAGGILFLGLALTFFLVYLLPTQEGRMYWAIWPAGILGAMGALLLMGSTGLARLVWPAALILFGGYMVLRALRPRPQ